MNLPKLPRWVKVTAITIVYGLATGATGVFAQHKFGAEGELATLLIIWTLAWCALWQFAVKGRIHRSTEDPMLELIRGMTATTVVSFTPIILGIWVLTAPHSPKDILQDVGILAVEAVIGTVFSGGTKPPRNPRRRYIRYD